MAAVVCFGRALSPRAPQSTANLRLLPVLLPTCAESRYGTIASSRSRALSPRAPQSAVAGCYCNQCSSRPARNPAATVRSAWERADALRPDRSAIRRLRSGPVASPRRVPFAVRSATAAVFRAGGTAHGRPLVRLVVGAAPRPARRRRLRSRMRAAWLGRNTSRRHPARLRGGSGVPCGPGRLPSPRRPSRPVR